MRRCTSDERTSHPAGPGIPEPPTEPAILLDMSDPRSPWPEDRPEDRPEDQLAFSGGWDEGRTDEELDRPAGSKGVAFTVALATFGFWVVLPVLVVVGVYSLLTVYAIVKAVGSAPDEPNAVAIALSIVGLITLFVVILGAAISLIGRAANPKRRH
jgi:hypothetical protein